MSLVFSKSRWRKPFQASLLLSTCLMPPAAAALAQTCQPLPSHGLATTLPMIHPGDYWIYTLTGTITPAPGASSGAPAGTAAPTGPVPIGGTFVEYAETRTFNGKPTLALVTTEDIQVGGSSIYGSNPVPVGIFYVKQDPATKAVYAIGDNMTLDGSARIARQPAEFYPGSWSGTTSYDDTLNFTNGQSTGLYLYVTGTKTIQTPIGNFQAWVAPNGASGGGISDTGIDYWAPQVGAPVAFSTSATLPNGQVNKISATLVKASTVAPLYPVVADSLDQPRGLAFDPLGDLWFTEAGVGGKDACIPFMGAENCFGNTGKVSAVAFGRTVPIVSTLASLSTPQADSSSGPNGIAFAGDLPYVVIGGGGPKSATDQLGGLQNQIGNLLGAGIVNNQVGVRAVASLEDFEYANFPHLPDPAGKPTAQSNPFGVASAGGNLYVADGAGQTVTEVTPGGAVSLVGIMPNQEVSVPGAGGAVTMAHENSVPTGIMAAPDGHGVLAADYSGYPYVVGSSRIFRFIKGQQPTVFASGLTNLIGLSPAPDGGVYALEMYAKGSLSSDPNGAIIHVNAQGTQDRTLSCHGLITPTGITTGRDGSIYVSNYGLVTGQGQVIRIQP